MSCFGGVALPLFKGHTGVVRCVDVSPDGGRVVTCSDDRTARINDAVSGKNIAVLKGHGGAVESCMFGPDGSRVVTTSADATAMIWDAADGTKLLTLEGHAEKLEGAEYSPDGHLVATASEDRTARVWDAVTGESYGVLARVELKSSTRLQYERMQTVMIRLFCRASRTRREQSIRPKISRIDFDMTELESSEVWPRRPSSLVDFHTGRGPRGRRDLLLLLARRAARHHGLQGQDRARLGRAPRHREVAFGRPRADPRRKRPVLSSKTANLPVSVTSRSFRLIFGRIVFSGRDSERSVETD